MAIPDSYLPASFYNENLDYGYWFTVTGDPVDNPVPEPATAICTLLGGLVLFRFRRK